MGIYLDNNATTRVDPAVLAEMLPFFTEVYGNPSSLHAYGATTGRRVEWAREQVAGLIGAAMTSEIVFTSGGTESDNAAILSALAARPERRTIVTSAVEHPAVLALCDHLEKDGYTVRRIGVDGQGRLDRAAYTAALDDTVAVASIMWANNETGTLFPVAELAEEAKAAGALFHTDAVQAAGRVPVCLAGTAIDFLSLSAHKLHGPKGIGALYVRRGVRFTPLVRGGRQERGRRAGTENVPGIAGFGKAAELARTYLPGQASVAALRDRLEAAVLAAVPDCAIAGDRDHRLPNTLSLVFDGVEGEAILVRLDRAGIAASQGSACSAGGMAPSHVLSAMGMPPRLAQGAIRLSLSRETTAEDIARVAAELPRIVAALRAPVPVRSTAGVSFQLAVA